jgi:type I restriction enzyme S subunit
MSVWEQKIFSELGVCIRGVSYKPEDLRPDFSEKSIALLRSNNIKNGRLWFHDLQFVDQAVVRDNQKLQNHDIAICMSNGNRALVGKSGQFIGDGDNVEYTVGAFCSIFRPATGFNATYIRYLFGSGDYQRQLDGILAGSAINNLRASDIHGLTADCPISVPEQNQIAAILSTLDKAIEQTEALIAKQQRIKTGLMQDLLTKGIDENGNIRSEATHEFKDSPLGRIPVEWQPTTLGRMAFLQRGYDIIESDFALGEFPVISSSGVIGYHNIFTSSGPNVVVGRKGSIGNVHFVETDFWAHDTSLFVTDFFGNCEKFVYYLFTYLDLGRYGTKSGSPSLNRNDIHPLPIGLPDPIEQKAIAEHLSAQDVLLRQFLNYLAKIRRLKTGLMHDLLTGKVRVTELLASQTSNG